MDATVATGDGTTLKDDQHDQDKLDSEPEEGCASLPTTDATVAVGDGATLEDDDDGGGGGDDDDGGGSGGGGAGGFGGGGDGSGGDDDKTTSPVPDDSMDCHQQIESPTKDLKFAPTVKDKEENVESRWDLGPETLDDDDDRDPSLSPKETALAIKFAAEATTFAENHKEEEDSDFPEGGWGWMIVVGLFILMFVLFGCVFSLSVFFVEWITYFDATATEVSWAISLTPALAGVASPVAGALCTRFGSRRVALLGSAITFTGVILAAFSQTITHLYITLGVMLGMGSSLVWSPSLVMLGQYFHRRYVLANSIAFCGYSCAQIVVPRLTQMLIEEYGWRGAMLIQSAMISHMFVTASLLKPRISPKRAETLQTRPSFVHYHEETKTNINELNPDTKEIWTSTTSLHMFDNILISSKSTTVLFREESTDKPVNTRWNLLSNIRSYISRFVSFVKVTYGLSALFKSPLYMGTVTATLAGGIGWFVTSIHLVARAVNAGISQNDAALLITLIGMGSFVGRAGHGFVIDRKWVGRQTMFTVSFGVTGVLSFMNPLMDTFQLLCVYSVLFGFNHGIANSLVFAMMKLQVSNNEAAAALSFGTLVFAVANTIGGVLAGVLFDATGGYDIPFYFAGAAILSGTLILSIVFTINHWRKDKLNVQTRRRSLFLRSQLYAQ
ncbi:monocarboxylate transporter 13-like isoform X1 [Amphiura filiformis]|uniref:monocarboxylate transporter 13-like isoform X1 n=1 Tax=Amphiura filiformis TaxID=82378 RepID=UPI003B22630F